MESTPVERFRAAHTRLLAYNSSRVAEKLLVNRIQHPNIVDGATAA